MKSWIPMRILVRSVLRTISQWFLCVIISFQFSDEGIYGCANHYSHAASIQPIERITSSFNMARIKLEKKEKKSIKRCFASLMAIFSSLVLLLFSGGNNYQQPTIVNVIERIRVCVRPKSKMKLVSIRHMIAY